MMQTDRAIANKVTASKIIFLGLMVLMFACTTEAQPINFGQDQCHFCKMTIVDKQFAAQCVTKKGKQFKYDATECLVGDLTKNSREAEMAVVPVSDYGGGPMLDAKAATYLISMKIKSPMGAFLSCFRSKDEASVAQKNHGGTLYTWQSLKEELSRTKP